MKLKNELGHINWRQELVHLLGESQPLKKARILVKQAQLKPAHYELLYKRISLYKEPLLLESPWQLRLLTGETCYFMQHLSKKGHYDNVLCYAIIAGVGTDILEKIRNKAPDMLSTAYQSLQLFYFIHSCKNKAALEWLIRKLPQMGWSAYNCQSLLETSNWTEGLEILAERFRAVLEPISFNFNELYNSPKLCAILKDNNHFPFSLKSAHTLRNMQKALTSKWEHEVPIIDWCKSNIPGFITSLKERRDLSGRTLLHRMLDFETKVVDRALFTSIAREIPELLDIKNKAGESLAWVALKQDKGDDDLFKFVYSFNKKPAFLDGISFKNNEADSSCSYSEDEELITNDFEYLKKALSQVPTIQTLGFTTATKKQIQAYINNTKQIPACFYYLIQNYLLVLLCSMADTNSLLSPLYPDLMTIIANKLVEITVSKLVELSPPPAKLFLTSTHGQTFFKVFEKSSGEPQEEKALDCVP